MNLAKGGQSAQTVLERRRKERPCLRLFEQAWSLQTLLGGHVHSENPTGSLAWKELNLGIAYEVDVHMCSLGLVWQDTGLPVRKPTRVVTSDPGLVLALRACRCTTSVPIWKARSEPAVPRPIHLSSVGRW